MLHHTLPKSEHPTLPKLELFLIPDHREYRSKWASDAEASSLRTQHTSSEDASNNYWTTTNSNPESRTSEC